MLACLPKLDGPQGLLKGKSFLGGSRPGAEDACVYSAASALPPAVLKAAPGVKGWLNTVGLFAPSLRGSWGGGGGGASAPAAGGAKKDKKAAAAAPAAAAAKNSGGDDDDDVDSLFGDDEEDGGAEKGASGGKSRAEQMAAAKSAKDANKKVDR